VVDHHNRHKSFKPKVFIRDTFLFFDKEERLVALCEDRYDYAVAHSSFLLLGVRFLPTDSHICLLFHLASIHLIPFICFIILLLDKDL
jgi:hypothetical protein